jgi:hypothetical protein
VQEDVMGFPVLPVILFLSIGVISLFSFVAVAAWSDSRRKERIAYYRSETLKKIAETAGPGSNAPLEYMHEEERISARHRRESYKLGSLITGAVGIGLIVFLRGIAPEESVYLAGLIPLLIGVALFAYAQFLAPKL